MSVLVNDVQIIEVQHRGLPGTGMTLAEYTTLRSDANTLLARPVITILDDVPDVILTSPAAGHILVRDAAGNWVNQAPSPAITVTDSASIDLTLTGTDLTAAAIFAGSGSASTVARSDHAHTADTVTRATFGPGGYMSTGTRSLASANVTLANGIPYLVQARLNMQMRGADAGAAYYQLTVTINGVARTSTGGSNGFWAVQGVPDKTTWEFSQQITGTGAAITCSASVSYFSGAGFYTDAGELAIELRPGR